MPQMSRMPLGPHRDASFLWPERSQVFIAMALGACLTTLIFLSGRHGAHVGIETMCGSLDAAASAVVERLVHARDEASKAHLGDAVFQLQRARKNCRYGFVGMARRDYNALLTGEFNRSN